MDIKKKYLLAFLAITAAVTADLSCINTCYNDSASLQLPTYKERHKGRVNILTTSNGAPVDVRYTTALNGDLIDQDYFLELQSSIDRSKIPERVVHAKAAGAFGYFEVTNDEFAKHCKADLFSKIGKKTPIVVRFSLGSQEKGGSDTISDVKGFAIKFYTQKGNLDLILLNTPMFTYKDPIAFLPADRINKRNPVTNLLDPHMRWDFIVSSPVILPITLYLFGDNGISDGYRHMPGHSLHTYQVYNRDGKSTYCRFKAIPTCGIKNLFLDEAKEIGCMDPDYATRDLYNAIARKDYPTYAFGVQCLSEEQVKNCSFDVFDVTKILPEKDYPVMPVGTLVLNENPTDYFAQVEQVAYCPSTLVPGLLGAPDNVFKSRKFAYKDAQRYRLGSNFENIPVNRPLNKVYNYDRDGRPPIPSTGTDGPNYYPNSYGGPVPYVEKNRPSMIKIKQRDTQHDFGQIRDIYNELSDAARTRMAGNICDSLGKVNKELQNRVLKLFASVSTDLKFRVSVKLASQAKSCKAKTCNCS